MNASLELSSSELIKNSNIMRWQCSKRFARIAKGLPH